jgi:hypothetical protein
MNALQHGGLEISVSTPRNNEESDVDRDSRE